MGCIEPSTFGSFQRSNFDPYESDDEQAKINITILFMIKSIFQKKISNHFKNVILLQPAKPDWCQNSISESMSVAYCSCNLNDGERAKKPRSGPAINSKDITPSHKFMWVFSLHVKCNLTALAPDF